jgi:hypothetical protein
MVLAIVLLLPTPIGAPDFSSPDDEAIAFGAPSVFDNARGLELIAVLVISNSDQMKSFLTRAS